MVKIREESLELIPIHLSIHKERDALRRARPEFVPLVTGVSQALAAEGLGLVKADLSLELDIVGLGLFILLDDVGGHCSAVSGRGRVGLVDDDAIRGVPVEWAGEEILKEKRRITPSKCDLIVHKSTYVPNLPLL